MFRTTYGFAFLGFLCLHAQSLGAQMPDTDTVTKPCDKSCQQEKIEALFKAMDGAAASSRPKPSDSKECSTFDGRNVADPLLDVCAKLKYVRSIAAGTDTNFPCPRDASALVGLPAGRIRAVWGEPDFAEGATSPNGSRVKTQWTYFIGNSKPGVFGGGFPELSLHFDSAGGIRSVSCALSR